MFPVLLQFSQYHCMRCALLLPVSPPGPAGGQCGGVALHGRHIDTICTCCNAGTGKVGQLTSGRIMVGARLGTSPTPNTDGDGSKAAWHKARPPALLRLTQGTHVHGLRAMGVAGVGPRTHPVLAARAPTALPGASRWHTRPRRTAGALPRMSLPRPPHKMQQSNWPSCTYTRTLAPPAQGLSPASSHPQAGRHQKGRGLSQRKRCTGDIA
jgi:hypothetical protein